MARHFGTMPPPVSVSIRLDERKITHTAENGDITIIQTGLPQWVGSVTYPTQDGNQYLSNPVRLPEVADTFTLQMSPFQTPEVDEASGASAASINDGVIALSGDNTKLIPGVFIRIGRTGKLARIEDKTVSNITIVPSHIDDTGEIFIVSRVAARPREYPQVNYQGAIASNTTIEFSVVDP